MKDNKKLKDSQIFDKETGILARTDNIIQDQEISKTELVKEYKFLSGRYKKLLQGIKQITQLGDMYQKKFRVANIALENANNKIMKDLELARKLQFSLLPKTFPNSDKVEFFGQFIPSEKLSGDFYEVFLRQDGLIGMYIFDVCGHGVASAMITVFAKEIIESIHLQEHKNLQPQEFLKILNKRILQMELGGGFCTWYLTMVYAVYDPQTREFTYATAGHEHIYRITFSQEPEIHCIAMNSFAIGWFDFAEYEQKTITLNPLEKIVLVTDGILEAGKFQSEDMFGYDRFRNSLITSTREVEEKNFKTSYILKNLMNDILDFSHKKDQDDDITMLLMNVKG